MDIVLKQCFNVNNFIMNNFLDTTFNTRADSFFSVGLKL